MHIKVYGFENLCWEKKDLVDGIERIRGNEKLDIKIGIIIVDSDTHGCVFEFAGDDLGYRHAVEKGLKELTINRCVEFI